MRRWARRGIPGMRRFIASPAARAAARRSRSPQDSRPRRSAPTPEARSAFPPRCAGLTGLKPTYGVVSLAGVFPLADDARFARPACAHRRRRRAAHRGDGRTRSARSGVRSPRPRSISPARSPTSPTCAACASPRLPSSSSPGRCKARRARRARGGDRDAALARRDRRGNARALRLRGRDAAQRPHHRRRGLRAAPRVHRRRVAAVRSVGAQARCSAARRSAPPTTSTRSPRASAIAAAFADWMRGRDALLTPTLPITATPLDEVDEATTPLATFTRAANYLGACALSLPAGFSAHGSADRRAAHGRAVRRRDAGATRARLPARDRLAPAPAERRRVRRVVDRQIRNDSKVSSAKSSSGLRSRFDRPCSQE